MMKKLDGMKGVVVAGALVVLGMNGGYAYGFPGVRETLHELLVVLGVFVVYGAVLEMFGW